MLKLFTLYHDDWTHTSCFPYRLRGPSTTNAGDNNARSRGEETAGIDCSVRAKRRPILLQLQPVQAGDADNPTKKDATCN